VKPRLASRSGVILTWLLGGLVLGVFTLGAMVRQRNLATRAANERAARQRLAELKGPVGVALARGESARVRALLVAAANRPDVSEAVLLQSKKLSADLSFLRDVHLVAHGDRGVPVGPIRGDKRAQALSPAYAKQLYDWTGRVLERKRTDLRWLSPPGVAERIEVGQRISLNQGEYVLGVRVKPRIRPVAVPVLLLVGMLLLGLAVPLANRAATGRWQWLASGAGLALMSAACAVLLAGYGAWVVRAPATTGAGGLLSTGLSLGVPGGGLGYVWGVLSLLVLGLVVLGWRGTGHRVASAFKEHRIAMAYIVPAALGMIVLVLVPFAVGIVLGFFNHCEGQFEYVGLANFTDILSGGGTSVTDPLNFWFTLGVTLLWTSLNVLLHVTIGLGLAMLLKDPLLKGKGVYRVLLILPWAVPNYITALMWKGMFHQQFGAVNQLLGVFGIDKVSWFSHFWTSFTANVVTNTWLGFPFMMVVTLGALQSIPTDLYEAAEVDGASKWYQFSRITLPLLKPALLPAVILGAIWTFNMFNVIYLVSAGEPAGSTDILITEAYRWAFIRHERYGLAAAYATLIFLILLAYSLITNRVAKGAEGTFK
jgi:ABC-type sugar transport system permease subunit